MLDSELNSLSGIQVLDLLRAGSLGVEEYTDALLRTLQTHESLNAMTALNTLAMRATARMADSTPQKDRGPLHGLPIVVKDNIDVVGFPCTAGSPALASHWPSRDADCVAALKAAGALVLGKCNLHEFALGVTSRNATYGAVSNPYAPDRIAGGSSGGTAAAIAARIAPVGLGTDTGGSIRIPAALCSVVGYRPSTGRWPARGVVPISVPTRDTAAPMARSVEDCALLDAVVCGDDPTLELVAPHSLRLGLPAELWSHLHQGMEQQLDCVLGNLARAGVTLVPLTLDVDLSTVGNVGLTIAMAENLPALRVYFAEHGLPFDPALLAAAIASPDVRNVFNHLTSANAPDSAAYADALHTIRERLQPAWSNAFAHHSIDALLMPTTPLPAARLGEDEYIHMEGRSWPTFDSYVRNCGPATLLGLPSVSLPAGFTDEQGSSLPIGLMLDGPRNTDRRLLAIAAALMPLLPSTPKLP